MMLTGLSNPPPQPHAASIATTTPVSGQPYATPELSDLHLQKSASFTGLVLDGAEPRIFPGIVDRRRRSSLRGSNVESEGGNTGSEGASYSGFVRGRHGHGDAESVVEEGEGEEEDDEAMTMGRAVRFSGEEEKGSEKE